MNRYARNTGFAVAIVGVGLIAVCEALITTRLEAWQARHAYGTGLFPRDWTWPGMPR